VITDSATESLTKPNKSDASTGKTCANTVSPNVTTPQQFRKGIDLKFAHKMRRRRKKLILNTLIF
jgi:hypothetical protein